MIDNILSARNHEGRWVNDTVDGVKAKMIHSQYDLDFAVIAEHTTKDLAQNAAQNLRYFSVLKDPLECDDQTDEAEALYNRLCQFTKEDLSNTNYAVIKDHSEMIDKELIDCTKFRIRDPYSKDRHFPIYNFWETTNMDPTFWEPHCKRFDGFFFVVDLSTFDEEIIDENGQEKNKIEHAWSVWLSLKTMNIPKMAVLTKSEEFLKKLQNTPISVCPSFGKIYQRFEASYHLFDRKEYAQHKALIKMVKEIGTSLKDIQSETKMSEQTQYPKHQASAQPKMSLSHRLKDEKTILVLGPPQCGKSTVIDAILSSQNEKVSLDDLKGNMIHSQYDFDFAVITEHTTRELEQNAAQNLNANYAVIRDYKLLCPGYIRQNAKSESMTMEISEDVSNLIEAYYVPNKVTIHSTKLKVNEDSIYNLWESTATDPSIWSSRSKQIEGIIYVVDLLSYGRSIVDEHGQKRNELEYTLSVWESFQKLGVPMMAVLTKTDQYSKIQSEELIKHISFRVKGQRVCLCGGKLDQFQDSRYNHWTCAGIYIQCMYTADMFVCFRISYTMHKHWFCHQLVIKGDKIVGITFSKYST